MIKVILVEIFLKIMLKSYLNITFFSLRRYHEGNDWSTKIEHYFTSY